MCHLSEVYLYSLKFILQIYPPYGVQFLILTLTFTLTPLSFSFTPRTALPCPVFCENKILVQGVLALENSGTGVTLLPTALIAAAAHCIWGLCFCRC